MTHLINAHDMAELTGVKTAKKQCEVLKSNGLRYTTRADGRPIMSWEAYNRQLSSNQTSQNSTQGPRLENL